MTPTVMACGEQGVNIENVGSTAMLLRTTEGADAVQQRDPVVVNVEVGHHRKEAGVGWCRWGWMPMSHGSVIPPLHALIGPGDALIDRA